MDLALYVDDCYVWQIGKSAVTKKRFSLSLQRIREWKDSKWCSCGYSLSCFVSISTKMDIACTTIIKTTITGVSIAKVTGVKLWLSGGTYMTVKSVAMLAQEKFLTNSLEHENYLFRWFLDCQLSWLSEPIEKRQIRTLILEIPLHWPIMQEEKLHGIQK